MQVIQDTGDAEITGYTEYRIHEIQGLQGIKDTGDTGNIGYKHRVDINRGSVY